MRNITQLMEELKKYTLQYAMENGAKLDGNNFVSCLFPDHEDADPSMHYWDKNNIFFCFGCGRSADIFTLANIYENKPLVGVDFIEDNVFYLAKRYGIEYEHLKKEMSPEDIKKATFYQTMKLFTSYVVQNKNKQYLDSRKITEKTAKELCIGSVKSYDDCFNFLISKGCNPDVIKEIGITKMKVNENKMIFIIKDENGRCVSFVSREMNNCSPDVPKYINGNATIIFNKSRIFYLWSDIKKDFSSMSSCIIVEGYIDAVTAYQYGYRQIVALGSASFTDEHINIIESSNKIEKVAVALDNDITGQKRMNTLLDRIKEQKTSKEYKFAVYKESGKDLDEILNHFGQKVELDKIFELKTLFDFELLKVKERYSELDESSIFDMFVKIISKTKRPKLREEQIRTLASYLNNYSYNTIIQEVEYQLSESEYEYKNTLDTKVNRALNEIKKNPNSVIGVLEDLKEQIDIVNQKFNKNSNSLFDEALEDFDNFEDEKKKYSLHNCKFGIPNLDSLDIAPGDIVSLGALPNVGKSTLFQKITRSVITMNEESVLIFASPDDPAEKIYANLIAALSGLPREYCKNPYFHKKYGLSLGGKYAEQYFEIYNRYKKILRSYIENKRIIIWDVKNGIGVWKNLEMKLNMISADKDLKEKYKVLICDPVNKIEVDGINNENETISYLSSHIKKSCENNKILAFLNFELNKLKNNTKLSQYNLSGSRRMNYDTNVLLFMYNPTRNLQEFQGTENETQMKWILKTEFGSYEQPILFTIQEKSKNGNEEMNGKPYFYKLNTFTSDLTPIDEKSEEHRYFYNIWVNEWNNLYVSY